MVFFTRKILYQLLGGIGLLLLVGSIFWRPIGAISVSDFSNFRPKHPNDLYQNYRDVELTAYVTGWVQAPANILIDQNSSIIPETLKQPQWVPSIAYTVRHPVYGFIILDTGLRAEECDYGMRPIYWVPCRNVLGSDLVSQLRASGIQSDEIRKIILSHFHGDHISGLSTLLAFANAPVLMTSAMLDEVRSPLRGLSGISAHMLKSGFDVELIDDYWRNHLELGRTFDVFGDGSLLLVDTNGHSRGHISALVKTSKRAFLLTFDAAHLRANVEFAVPSGSATSSADARASLALIQRLRSKNPDLMIVFGHEPTQWACGQGPIRLDIVEISCLETFQK